MLKNFIILMLCVASLQLLPVQANAQTTYDAGQTNYAKTGHGLMFVSVNPASLSQ